LVRAEKLETARLKRVQLRDVEFSSLWAEHLLTYTPEDRDFLPNSFDAALLPSVADALSEDGGNVIVTTERFSAILPGALIDSETYKLNVRSDLLKALKESGVHSESHATSSDNGADSSGVPDPLLQASAIFSCNNCRELFTFPSILSHSRKLRWRADTQIAHFATIKVQKLALEVLRIFKLPPNTLPGSDALKDINGRFICGCGSPTVKNPFDFMALVSGRRHTSCLALISLSYRYTISSRNVNGTRR
jgi:hypothetical protein